MTQSKPFELFLDHEEIGIKGRLLSDAKWMPKQYRKAFQLDILKLFERLNEVRRRRAGGEQRELFFEN